MSKQFPAILFAASLSSLVFLFVSVNNLDFILMFVSIIPLLSIGLSKGHKPALEASILATIPIAMFSGGNLFPAALFFFAFALPCWYACYMALRYHEIKFDNPPITVRLWYPTGLIIVHLAVYACVILAIATAIFATLDTNLPQFIAKIAQEVIEAVSKEYAIEEISPNHLAFLLCGSTAWLWCLCMFGYAWFVNYILLKKKLAQRPNLSVTPFPIPHWLLTLMSICALASIIGGESMSFLGKSAFFTLLIPYFFQGAAILNLSLKITYKNLFFISILYFIAIITFWPAMLLVGIGIWNHIKIFNKHLSSGGT